MVSELATNATLHAATPFTLALTLLDGRLRIAVSDGSRARPRISRLASPDATTGRGMGMVAALSAAWGVEADENGKTTWCELAVTQQGDGGDEDALTRGREADDRTDAPGRPLAPEPRTGAAGEAWARAGWAVVA